MNEAAIGGVDTGVVDTSGVDANGDAGGELPILIRLERE